VRRRRFGEVVCAELGAHCSAPLRSELVSLLGMAEEEIYPVDGLLDMGALWHNYFVANGFATVALDDSSISETFYRQDGAKSRSGGTEQLGRVEATIVVDPVSHGSG
jgi:hypothetical protein